MESRCYDYGLLLTGDLLFKEGGLYKRLSR